MSQAKLTPEELEALLQLAEQPASKEDSEPISSVYNWVKKMGIKPGEDKVLSSTLWYAYCKTVKRPVKPMSFYKEIGDIFAAERRRDSRGSFYRLDFKTLNLTDDDLFKIQHELREARQLRKKTSKVR